MLLFFSLAHGAPTAAVVFDRLTALVGVWEAPVGDVSVHVELSLVSRGSILMETYRVGTTTTISMLHVDGDHLVLTHYCAMGKQPRLWAAPTEGPLSFRFHDATNLAHRRDSHLDSATLSVTDQYHYTKTETYTGGGESETTELHFVRVPSAPSTEK